ncbi:hypothetical protein B0T24DRAFT_250336 [Lasiosphaeria ovina]|uniref:Rhodopsin domain-containing protein n=1 Tax=Lasiosphaeria ovina TaxID=92902 RepID=A0AAE0KBT5_9PEZI|nr:hypothetical protein B0T24DRAFT_250336 [Lasiosphaeria ovina]
MAMPFDINSIPAMQPPPGQTSNFVDPETLHPIVLGVAIATMIVMTAAVTIRVYTKAFVMRDMRFEEYFAIVATAGIILWDAIFIHVSFHGFTRHLWDVRYVDVHHLSYMNYLAEISNSLTMFAAKCSILLQLKRLFCTGQSRDAIYWAIHALMFLDAAYYTSAVFTFVFQCNPREKTWNPLMEGTCINVAAATVVAGAVNLFLDLGILLVPFWAICHLQLPLKRKLGISAVFGVGILTCAIAAVGVSLRVPLLTDPDLTWLISKVGIWTMLEYCGTILVGCMPSFPRFFMHLRGRDPLTSGSRSNNNNNNNNNYNHNHDNRSGGGHNNSNNNGTIGSAGGGGYRPGMGLVTPPRNKSAVAVGLALTTSEVSLSDAASCGAECVELEHGVGGVGGREPYGQRGSDDSGFGSRRDSEWSRSTSPV